MMRKIKNCDTLTNHGNAQARETVLAITEATLNRLDAKNRIASIMRREGHMLHIGTKTWDLSAKKNVYLIGSGKACNHMAMAVDEILGEYLTKGIIIVKIHEETDVFQRTKVHVGGHPIPNQAGYEGCLEILDLVDHAGPDDLFIGVISGGSSALMSCPIEGISLEDERIATDVLLKSGAGIYEVNAVRRHISAMNGGMLAKRIEQRGAEFIGFGISDAVGKPPTGDIGIPDPNYKSTPIGPDATTLDDARAVIRDYDLAERLPKAVVDHIMNAGPEFETPKAFPNNTYFLLNTLPDSVEYARQEAEKMGIKAVVLTSFLEGEASAAGSFMASLAREVATFGRPFEAPVLFISAGEVTTKILDNSVIAGHGGPGQEMTTGFALATAVPGAVMLSIDSEGTDGTTPAAGGITDMTTARRAEEKGLNLHEALRTHATYELLAELDDVVITGNTGTNLCDFNLLYIPRAEA